MREVKGIDLICHDWCDVSHDAYEHFISQIFRGQTTNIDDAVGNILNFLTELAAKVNSKHISSILSLVPFRNELTITQIVSNCRK